ncbi:FxsA family protein [Phycicoccus sp. CMS6Z-2]|nr:FxsA family protein [Phycicoccus flavus]
MVEIAVIIAVGRTIGGWPTFGLLLVESLIGAVIVRREGGRAWTALREALRSGRMPSRQLADAALVLVGGTLLLTPGFVTDAAGFFMVLPVTRPVTRRWLEAVVARRLLGPLGGGWPGGGAAGGGPVHRSPGGRGPGDPPDVVQGEVVD